MATKRKQRQALSFVKCSFALCQILVYKSSPYVHQKRSFAPKLPQERLHSLLVQSDIVQTHKRMGDRVVWSFDVALNVYWKLDTKLWHNEASREALSIVLKVSPYLPVSNLLESK